MKKTVFFVISLLLIMVSNLYGSYLRGGKNSDTGDSLKIVVTPELFNLSMKWADEYNRQFPGSNIKVIGVQDQKRAGDLIRKGNIGFASNNFFEILGHESLWKVVVGRDVIVPVINSQNPYMEQINQYGISPDDLALLMKNADSFTWGDLLKNGEKQKIDFYCIDDETSLGNLTAFIKSDKSILQGINITGSPEVVEAVQKDPLAMGFCRLTDIMDFQDQVTVEGIRLMPIDRDGNGLIDSNEKIYDGISDLTRGIWIGKYPRTLFSNIYTIASEQPVSTDEVAFVKWVLSDGQKYLTIAGYSDLLVSERQSNSDKLFNARIYSGASEGKSILAKSMFFVITTVILIGLIVSTVAKQRKRKKAVVKMTGSDTHPVLDESLLVIPGGIYFDKTHTWAFLEASGIVKVGIDDFLQHITGKITRIKMKDPGTKVKKGEPILSVIQNGKQLNLYAPVSGKIVENNISLDTNSSVINSSPYNDGWIYRIQPTNWVRESQLLFMADKQREFLKKEFARLKDFFMTSLGADPAYAQVVLQDGGEICDGVLSEMGPEIWEDFQTKFIDPSKQVWFYEIV